MPSDLLDLHQPSIAFLDSTPDRVPVPDTVPDESCGTRRFGAYFDLRRICKAFGLRDVLVLREMSCESDAMDPSIRLHQLLPLVERQHAVIEHLRARHPKITSAAQLADLVGVSRRTIERDAARLRAAGIPLQVVAGVRGGYRISASDRDRTVTLSPGEVSALLAALVAIGPYSSATAQSVFIKLTDVLAPEDSQTPP